ncbi:MAG: MerR family transcriptional regulator [Acidobacteriota bacterium]
MDIPNELFTVSHVCHKTGLSVDTLKWLEDEMGSILEIRRTPAGNRLFSAHDMDHLQEIKRLLDEEQMGVEEIKARLFPPLEAPSPADTLPAVSAGADPLCHEDGEVSVPPLPVASTVDLLLEATEGLVQENLKLRKAMDDLGERCMRLETRLDDVKTTGRRRWSFLRRS